MGFTFFDAAEHDALVAAGFSSENFRSADAVPSPVPHVSWGMSWQSNIFVVIEKLTRKSASQPCLKMGW